MYATETTSTGTWLTEHWSIAPHNCPVVLVEPPASETDLRGREAARGILSGDVQLLSDGPTEEDTTWFLSAEWQAGERRVDEHVRAGRVSTYASVGDFLTRLHRRTAQREQGADRVHPRV